MAVIRNFDGCVHCCQSSCRATPTPTPFIDFMGRRVYVVTSGQFVLVIEGAPGDSGFPVAFSLEPAGEDGRPDLQIQSTRSLGDGSLTVCDTGPAAQGGGGVPGMNPPTFDPSSPAVTDALLDFACRFQAFSAGAPCTFTDSSGDPKLINSASTVQFCDFIATTAAFPFGDSVVTARLRDTSQNPGPTAQIVVRVVTPTPTSRP